MIEDVKTHLLHMPVPSIQNVQQLLGPPDSGGGEYRNLEYSLGMKHGSVIPGQRYNLFLLFNDDDMLLSINVWGE
jgi:hypothetical protein